MFENGEDPGTQCTLLARIWTRLMEVTHVIND